MALTLTRPTTLTDRIRSGATIAPATPANNPADTGLLRSSVADILGLRAQATTDAANAAAQEISARGLGLEAEAYGTAAGIAGDNAMLAGIAGEITALREAREVRRTVGAQRAAVASAGFGASGTSLDLLRASFQEGHLSDQLIRTQTSLAQGGYLQEGAAARAEGMSASFASEAALSLARTHRAAGSLATANAAAQTEALAAYISSTSGGAPLTPAQQLALSALSGDPAIGDRRFEHRQPCA
jgi:hypothetical protein